MIRPWFTACYLRKPDPELMKQETENSAWETSSKRLHSVMETHTSRNQNQPTENRTPGGNYVTDSR